MDPTGHSDNLVDLPTDATDRSLAVAVHEGDSAAALALIERYTAPLFNLIHRTTGMSALAADLTRDVLAAAITSLGVRVPPPEERWIARLAADVWKGLLATGLKPDRPTHRVRISPRHWKIEALRLADDSRTGSRRLGQKLRQRLWRAWSALTMRERFVLTLSDTMLLSVPELSRALGESESAARTRRDEAKLALMARLTERQSSWPLGRGGGRGRAS